MMNMQEARDAHADKSLVTIPTDVAHLDNAPPDMMITVITGPPGSGQFEVAEAMINAHAGEKATWMPSVLIDDGIPSKDTTLVDKLDKVMQHVPKIC